MLCLLAAAGSCFHTLPAEAANLPFADLVDTAGRRHDVDPDLVHAVIAVESGYRASAQSRAGAQGLMQLMPGTQSDFGVSDAFDPRQNVDAGVAYLRRLTDEFGTRKVAASVEDGTCQQRRPRSGDEQKADTAARALPCWWHLGYTRTSSPSDADPRCARALKVGLERLPARARRRHTKTG